jgi:hypothetical protein
MGEFGVQQEPIIMHRDPTVRDGAEVGVIWVNQTSNAWWILTSNTGGVNTWTASTAGAIVAASMTLTGGNLVVGAAGNVTVAGGDLTVTGATQLNGTLDALATTIVGATTITGNTILNGDLTVTGDCVVTGDFDITDTASIGLTSTNNAAGAITLTTNGGVAETMVLNSVQGTGAGAVTINSTAGGVVISANRAAATSIDLVANNAAGGITLQAGTAGVHVTNTNGPFHVTTGTGQVDISADAAATTVNIATGAAAKTCTVGSANGASITTVNSGTAGLAMTSTGISSLDAAGISLDSTIASNFTVTGAGLDLLLNSVGGSVLVRSTEAAAQAIRLHANGGVTETIQLHSEQGTAANSINLLSDLGGLTLTATGNATADAINLEAPLGGLDINTGLQINIDSAEAAATAIAIHASDAAGGITIDAGTGGTVFTNTNGIFDVITGTGAINIGADAFAKTVTIGNNAGASSVVINGGTGAMDFGQNGIAHAIRIGNAVGATSVAIASGTGDVAVTSTDAVTVDAVGVLELNSSAAAIGIGSDADNFAVNVGTAGARVVTVGNVTGATQVVLNSGTAGVAINTTGAGDFVVTSADTVLIDSAGVLELNSSAGIIGIGNDAVAQNINIGTGAAARTVTIGNTSAASSVLIEGGTGNIFLGVTATDHPTQVGSVVGASLTTIRGGTAGITMTASFITLGTVKIYTGAGDPAAGLATAIGDLYIRTDAVSAVTRMFCASAANTWVNFTMSA